VRSEDLQGFQPECNNSSSAILAEQFSSPLLFFSFEIYVLKFILPFVVLIWNLCKY